MAYFIPQPTAFSVTPNYSTQPFVSGYEIVVTGLNTFIVKPGCARALTNNTIIQYPGTTPGQLGAITVNMDSVGLNGCYPIKASEFKFAFNTVFCVYAISDDAGKYPPGIVVATGDNFLPAGYNSFVRIGFIYTNGPLVDLGPVGTIYPWIQSGSSMDRQYSLQNSRTLISGGTATTYTQVPVGQQNQIVPPKFGVDIQLTCRFQANNLGDDFNLSYNGISGFQVLGGSVSNLAQQELSFRMTAGQDAASLLPVIYYLVSTGASIQLNLIGFTDNLGNSLF